MKKIIIFSLSAICTLLLCIASYAFTGYEDAVESTLPSLIKYKNVEISMAYSADILGRLSMAENDPYYGEIPAILEKIEISVPQRAAFIIFPCDDGNSIVEYIPQKGQTEYHYIKTSYNKMLSFFYEMTNHEVFITELSF